MTGSTNHTYQQMSEQDFSMAGREAIAYVKPIQIEGGPQLWAIFAADGTQVGAKASLAAAQATILQNGLTPLSLH